MNFNVNLVIHIVSNLVGNHFKILRIVNVIRKFVLSYHLFTIGKKNPEVYQNNYRLFPFTLKVISLLSSSIIYSLNNNINLAVIVQDVGNQFPIF